LYIRSDFFLTLPVRIIYYRLPWQLVKQIFDFATNGEINFNIRTFVTLFSQIRISVPNSFSTNLFRTFLNGLRRLVYRTGNSNEKFRRFDTENNRSTRASPRRFRFYYSLLLSWIRRVFLFALVL